MRKYFNQVLLGLKSPPSINIFIKLTATATAVVTIFFIAVLIKNSQYGFNNFDSQLTGHIGDFFGGVVGSLLTFLSFLYILKTFEVQKQQVEIQRDELTANQFNYLYKFIDDKWNELYNEKLDLDTFTYLDIWKSRLNTLDLNDVNLIVEIGSIKIINNLKLVSVFQEQCKGLIFEDFILDNDKKNKLLKKVNVSSSLCQDKYIAIHDLNVEKLKDYPCYDKLNEIKDLFSKITFLAL